MSIKVMTRVWDQSTQKGSTLLLLLALADHAADDGFCWPGTKRLARKIRMDVRSVYRKIQQLEDEGELVVVREQGPHNWYIVSLGMTDEQVDAVLAARGLTRDQKEGDNLSRDNQDTSGDKPVTSQVTEPCHPNHHDPSSNHHKEGADAPSAPGADLALFLGTEEEVPNPAEERLERMRAKMGSTVLGVVAHCAERQAVEGQWTVPKHGTLSPQCSVFKEATGYSPPGTWRDDIDEQVPGDDRSLQDWYKVCHSYVGCGYSPRNVQAMLDFYGRGEIPSTKPKGNGGSSTPRPQQSEMTRELAAELDAIT